MIVAGRNRSICLDIFPIIQIKEQQAIDLLEQSEIGGRGHRRRINIFPGDFFRGIGSSQDLHTVGRI